MTLHCQKNCTQYWVQITYEEINILGQRVCLTNVLFDPEKILNKGQNLGYTFFKTVKGVFSYHEYFLRNISCLKIKLFLIKRHES